MTALSVPEVLRRAEAVIGERGWLVGNYTDTQGRVCAQGAIYVAAGSTGWYPPTGDAEFVIALDAVQTLRTEVGRAVAPWNDAPGRTADEVRAALLRAADRAVTE